MTKKTKIYDPDTEDSFVKKIVNMGIVTYKGSTQTEPTFNIENDNGGEVLRLKSSGIAVPSESTIFLKFDGSSSTAATLSGYTGGPSGSGIVLDLYKNSTYKDIGFKAGSLDVFKASTQDAKVYVNTDNNSAVLNISAIENNSTLSLEIDENNSNSNWIELLTSGSNQPKLSLDQDSDNNVRFSVYPKATATKGLYVNTNSGGMQLESVGELSLAVNPISSAGSDARILLSAGSKQVKISGTGSEPIIHIDSTPNINKYWLKCDNAGGIVRKNGDPTPNGNMDAFRAIDHSGAYDNFGRSKSGLQFLSGNSDFAEYFDVEYEDFLKYESDGVIDLPEGIIVYVRDNKCRAELPGIPMVVSKSALLAGNMNDGMNNLLSFSGQLRVFVKGPVDSGDLLVPMESICVAIKKEEATMSQYIDAVGRAIESSKDEGLKKVNCLIGIK